MYAILSQAATLHVSPGGSHTPPFDSWETAATTIQSAVNATIDGDTVLVGDGHYILSAEISVAKDIVIVSSNGWASTIVDGGGTVRCFDLGASACVVKGFTITHGHTSGNGGGVFCDDGIPLVENCIFTDNWSCMAGGGMRGGTARNCAFSGNMARSGGGGLSFGTATNCSFVGNWALRHGGGAINSFLANCIVWDNIAFEVSSDLYDCTAEHSCSPELEHGASGNITNAPLMASSFHISTIGVFTSMD
ncbi:right-handed parallel beta-helix repeat-containing protein [Pontiella desulfatans]|nr:hypothetical protein [Pontiella desulfatans]